MVGGGNAGVSEPITSRPEDAEESHCPRCEGTLIRDGQDGVPACLPCGWHAPFPGAMSQKEAQRDLARDAGPLRRRQPTHFGTWLD